MVLVTQILGGHLYLSHPCVGFSNIQIQYFMKNTHSNTNMLQTHVGFANIQNKVFKNRNTIFSKIQIQIYMSHTCVGFSSTKKHNIFRNTNTNIMHPCDGFSKIQICIKKIQDKICRICVLGFQKQ